MRHVLAIKLCTVEDKSITICIVPLIIQSEVLCLLSLASVLSEHITVSIIHTSRNSNPAAH